MWPIILSAIALVLVIEGIMPFLSPSLWRMFLARLITRNDSSIRVMGFLSLLSGTILMYLVHSGILFAK